MKACIGTSVYRPPHPTNDQLKSRCASDRAHLSSLRNVKNAVGRRNMIYCRIIGVAVHGGCHLDNITSSVITFAVVSLKDSGLIYSNALRQHAALNMGVDLDNARQ